MEKDLISIIVPVYNVERYINRCVESILNQTYKNIECLLIDDGSPDECGKICDDFSVLDNRVKVIHKSNGGLSSARNEGLKYANGKYIMFADSDDCIDVRMCEILYNSIVNMNADLAVCDINYVYDDDNIDIYQTKCEEHIDIEILNMNEAANKLFQKNEVGKFVISCNKLYKRELWDNIRYPEGEINEDEAVIHWILCKCKTVVSVNKKLYFYFQREDSIMHQKISEKNLYVFQVWAERYILMERYVDKNNLKKTLRLYLWKYMDYYYAIWETNKNSNYFPKMKRALKKIIPMIKRYNVCSWKEIISFRIFLMSSQLYKFLFLNKGKDNGSALDNNN